MKSCENQKTIAYITAFTIQFLCKIFVVKDKGLTNIYWFSKVSMNDVTKKINLLKIKIVHCASRDENKLFKRK